jgi:hypothetical protein
MQRISVELLDADGCLYNTAFLDHLTIAVHLHGAFLRAYAKKNSLDATSIKAVTAMFEEIRTSLHDGYSEDLYSTIEVEGSDIIQAILDMMNLSDAIGQSHSDLYKEMLVSFNQALIQQITARAHEYDQFILMIGSQRQSQDYDQRGMLENDIFLVKQALKSLLPGKKISVSKHTVTDLQHRRELGDTFRKIMSCAESQLTHFYDQSKLSIVYGAIHHIAATKRCNELHINYYDDLSDATDTDADILQTLAQVFKNYPSLLPAHTKLSLHHYDGEFNHTETIQGTGVIDYRYGENVRLLATMCGHHLKIDADMDVDMDVARTVDIEEFLLRRVTGTELIPYPPARMFAHPPIMNDADLPVRNSKSLVSCK